jgi:hypothetical protein
MIPGAVHRAAALLALVLSATVVAQDGSASPPAQRYPAGSIHSVEQAEQAIADVTRERAAIENRYVSEEAACYDKFFVSACLDGAKERRRQALQPLRNIENEAKHFQRQARVDERDKALAEKRAQEESEQAERQKRSEEEKERSARAAARAEQPHGPQGTPDPDRVARHAEKLRRIEAAEAAKEKERAENVAAYRRKVEEAEAHRKEVERRKAEKQRERAERQNLAPPAQ